ADPDLSPLASRKPLPSISAENGDSAHPPRPPPPPLRSHSAAAYLSSSGFFRSPIPAPATPGARLIPSLTFESSVGEQDKHVLKSVVKVGKFVQDMNRKVAEEQIPTMASHPNTFEEQDRQAKATVPFITYKVNIDEKMALSEPLTAKSSAIATPDGSKEYDFPSDPRETNLNKHSDIYTVLASGCALISDGYQITLMVTTNVLFTKRYGNDVYNSEVATRVSNSLLVGGVIGQVVVGLICDRIGRKSAIFWWLTIARGGVGVGVGGEYPASSTSASEAANEKFGRKKRGTVFSFVTNVVLVLGGFSAIFIFLIVLSASQYGNTTSDADMRSLDITWRICFGIGALLPLIVFYFRWKMMNSKLYHRGAIRKNVPYLLAIKRYWKRFLGTSLSWAIYAFCVFPAGISSGTIIATIVKDPTLKITAEYQLLFAAMVIPGAVLGAFALPYFGSKYLLITGLAGYLIINLSIGLAWDKLMHNAPAFVVLFGLLNTFGSFGPGTACGLVSVESYPTALRGTFYGLSAAVAQTGAVIGTHVFRYVQDHYGKKWPFIIAAIVGLVGIVIAYFFVLDTTKFDLEAEDEAWRQYLLANGWNHEMGDGSSMGPSHLASEVVRDDDGRIAPQKGVIQDEEVSSPSSGVGKARCKDN
ncbi:hypothetical protein CF327_g7131, partial [Tilletia walkeri]